MNHEMWLAYHYLRAAQGGDAEGMADVAGELPGVAATAATLPWPKTDKIEAAFAAAQARFAARLVLVTVMPSTGTVTNVTETVGELAEVRRRWTDNPNVRVLSEEAFAREFPEAVAHA